MRHILRATFVMLLGGGLASASLAAGTAGSVSWDEQNRAMGYLVMHLSSINAINGLNLTRSQAMQLRALARQIDAVAPPRPNLTGTYRPDLAEVRDVYMEIRKHTLAGEELPADLEKKVGPARIIQAHVARMSLIPPAAGAIGCPKCHSQPSADDVRALSTALKIGSTPLAQRSPQLTVFLAHQNGLFGPKGHLALLGAVSQVDKILTPEQKAVVKDFSCCLAPPKNLSDPVRAGQAEGGEGAMKILRYVRGVPQDKWPAVEAALMTGLDHLAVVLKTGVTEAEKAEARRQVAAVYQKARSLSETDFEMEKDKLAADLTKVTKSSKELDERGRAYMTATFLLVPGAVEAYDRLLQRLPTGEQVQR